MTWTWRQATSAGDVPHPRSSHSVVAVQGSIYVFGGEQVPRTPLPNDVFRYDLGTDTWHRVQTSGEAPCGRVGAAAAAIGSEIYVFGGRTGKDFGDSSLNDLHVLDTRSGVWRKLEAAGSVPQQRSYHAAAVAGDKFYVFGGCGSDGRLNELHVYDPASSEWQQLPASDAVPARGGAAFVGTGDCLYVIGGFNGSELGDTHVFDVAAGSWKQLDTSSAQRQLPPRSVTGIVATSSPGSSSGGGSMLLLFGGEVEPTDLGHDAAGSYCNELWAFGTARPGEGWQGVDGVSGGPPPPRGWMQAAALPDGGGLAVHGGNAPDNSRLGDMWLLQRDT